MVGLHISAQHLLANNHPLSLSAPFPLQALLTEKRVRRRLRLLAAEGHRKHRSRMLWWALALLPQLPLMVSSACNGVAAGVARALCAGCILVWWHGCMSQLL